MSSRKLCIALFMSLILFVSSMPNIVWAGQTEVSLNHPEGENLTRLSGLVIGGLDEPEEGKPLDENATVTSKNGMSWDIPAFWVDENFETALEYKENLSPLLAFYLPQGYTFDGTVLLDDYLTSVFNAIGHVETNYDEATGITFIFGVVNVIYKTVSYGASGTATGKKYEEPDDETTDDPDWDPDNLGDFEGEEDDDGVVNPQNENTVQPDAGQTDSRPDTPASGDGSSDGKKDSSEDEAGSLYEQFRDAYAGNYENVDWKKEAERFGGLDQIDWNQMASVIGYDNLKTIYDNRQSYCDYITENGGTEEDCSALSGKIEASLEKIKPQNDVADADSETTSAAAMSERLPALTDTEDVSAGDAEVISADGEAQEDSADAKTQEDSAENETQADVSEDMDDAAPEGASDEVISDAAPEGTSDEIISDAAPVEAGEAVQADAPEEAGEAVQAEAPKPEKPAPKAEAPKPEKPAPKAEAPKPESPAPKAEAPKPEKPEPKAEAPKPESPEPKKEAPKPEKPAPKAEAPKEEASVPEQPAPAAQDDASGKEACKTAEENKNE